MTDRNMMTRHTLCERCDKDCRECPVSGAAWLSLVVVMAMLGMVALGAVLMSWLSE